MPCYDPLSYYKVNIILLYQRVILITISKYITVSRYYDNSSKMWYFLDKCFLFVNNIKYSQHLVNLCVKLK